MTLPLLSFLLPLGAVVLGMPLAMAFARMVGLVDRPDQRRKLHARVVPLAGGAMVLLAVVAAHIAVADKFKGPQSILSAPMIFIPLLALFVIGLLDDRFRLPGRIKLAGQLVVAVALIGAGFHIQTVNVFGWEANAGLCALPLTLIWLVGSANSVNLLDGMDGMVGTIGVIIAGAIAAVAFVHGQTGTALSALMICGALAGFLVFNLPSASVFMGDAGSLTLGMTLGILALGLESTTGQTVLGGLAFALMLLPICDSCAAVVRRHFTGQSIFATDRGHLHHRLRQAGLSVKKALALVATLNLVLAAGVCSWAFLGSYAPVPCAVVLVASILVLGRLFGHSEAKLLARRVAHLLRLSPYARMRLGRMARVHLQGSFQCWDEIWKGFQTQATALKPRSLTFTISAPAIHETYHARWDGPANHDEAPSDWRIQMPVRLELQVIGWVEVVAEFCPRTGPQAMASVTDLVEDLELRIAHEMSLRASAPEPIPEVVATRRRPRLGSHPQSRRMTVGYQLVPAIANAD
jgi:UDP-GlcNAc:undecaprenyl-phosphate/decaprenyl-phosphate GlcNAc-1-phosphate transferase